MQVGSKRNNLIHPLQPGRKIIIWNKQIWLIVAGMMCVNISVGRSRQWQQEIVNCLNIKLMICSTTIKYNWFYLSINFISEKNRPNDQFNWKMHSILERFTSVQKLSHFYIFRWSIKFSSYRKYPKNILKTKIFREEENTWPIHFSSEYYKHFTAVK